MTKSTTKINEKNKESNKKNNKNNKIKKNNDDEPFVLSPNENIENIENTECHRLYFDLNANFIFPKYKKQNLLYDTVMDKKNNWKIVNHPLPAPIDRDAGTKIKFSPIKYNNKMEKNNGKR